MSKRYHFCFNCNRKLGEKTAAGLKADQFTAFGQCKIMCNTCKKTQTVRMGLLAAQAQADGLTSLVANKVAPVPKDGMDWGVLQHLHETDRLEIIPLENGALLLHAKTDNSILDRAVQAVEDSVASLPPGAQMSVLDQVARGVIQQQQARMPPQQQQTPPPAPPRDPAMTQPIYESRPESPPPAPPAEPTSFRSPLPAEDDGIPSGIPASTEPATTTATTPEAPAPAEAPATEESNRGGGRRNRR